MSQRPNVLVLMLDTARAQNFSCYGYKRSTTPYIDAIAAEGVVFEQAIAPGCWSLPSQVSLLSGMFPIKHGAHELHLRYDHPYPLLPEILRQAGYHTLGISPNSWMSDEFGVTHGFDTYLKLWQYWQTMPADTAQSPLAQKVNQLYSRYVFPSRNRARHVNGHLMKHLDRMTEPFFGYCIFWDMHLPYHPRGKHRTTWLPAGVTRPQARRVNRSHLRYFAGQAPMSDDDFNILRACYDGALATIDEEIGRLVADLRRRNVLDHTMLIITSDHGENLGEHGLMSHAYSLHDTLIHVPLIIRYPERFAAGQRVAHQVQLTDILPTILDVAQLKAPQIRAELQGESLLAPTPDAIMDRYAYAELLSPHPSMQTVNRRNDFPADTPRPEYDHALRCLRTLTHKLIWASDGQHALYDLQADPHETTNRFEIEPKIASELMEVLQTWQPPHGELLQESIPDVDHALRQRLRDLGYID
ncbi:MAG: sulfatase [bacterium]|nr:sulfatase [bacterium]